MGSMDSHGSLRRAHFFFFPKKGRVSRAMEKKGEMKTKRSSLDLPMKMSPVMQTANYQQDGGVAS